jgi:alpha-galactosidase
VHARGLKLGIYESAGTPSIVGNADGVTLYTSPTVTSTSPVQVDVTLAGRTTLHLTVADAGDGKDFDHADGADARLLC